VPSADATIAQLRRRGMTIVVEPFEVEEIGRKIAFFSDPSAICSNLRKYWANVQGPAAAPGSGTTPEFTENNLAGALERGEEFAIRTDVRSLGDL